MSRWSELGHMPISKSIYVHGEWDHPSCFRLLIAHFPALGEGIPSLNMLLPHYIKIP